MLAMADERLRVRWNANDHKAWADSLNQARRSALLSVGVAGMPRDRFCEVWVDQALRSTTPRAHSIGVRGPDGMPTRCIPRLRPGEEMLAAGSYGGRPCGRARRGGFIPGISERVQFIPISEPADHTARQRILTSTSTCQRCGSSASRPHQRCMLPGGNGSDRPERRISRLRPTRRRVSAPPRSNETEYHRMVAPDGLVSCNRLI